MSPFGGDVQFLKRKVDDGEFLGYSEDQKF
jgi:hypothetical protein